MKQSEKYSNIFHTPPMTDSWVKSFTEKYGECSSSTTIKSIDGFILVPGLWVINVCRLTFEFTFTDELCQIEDLFSTENTFCILL